MTPEAIKRLRELCGIYIESVEKDDCRWVDFQKEYDERTMPLNILKLLDALEKANAKCDRLRAALGAECCRCKEIKGAEIQCHRCAALAEFEGDCDK